MSEVSEKIAERRMELHLTDTQVAQQAGLSFNEYFDIELHADEIYTVTSLGIVKKLTQILGLDFLSLFEMPCAFCGGSSINDEYRFPRNVLIRNRRESKGLSTDELGDRIGFYGIAIVQMEADPDFLETWPLRFIQNLANEIEIPLQVLLSVKCDKCAP